MATCVSFHNAVGNVDVYSMFYSCFYLWKVIGFVSNQLLCYHIGKSWHFLIYHTLNKSFRQSSDHLHHCSFMAAIHYPFVWKYEQLFHEQRQNNSIKVRLFQLLHLHISVNMAVAQKKSPMTLVCDGDVDKENLV